MPDFSNSVTTPGSEDLINSLPYDVSTSDNTPQVFKNSPKAAYVYSGLKENRDSLDTIKSSSDSFLLEAEEELDKYLVTVKALDNYILGRVNEINDKKTQIVNILTTNFNAINTGLPEGCLLSTSSNDTNDFIVVAGTDQLFNYGTLNQYQGIRAEVREDVLYCSEYPLVESYDLSVEDPEIESDNQGNQTTLAQNTRITSQNIGLGYMDMFFNSLNDPAPGYSANSNLIGYYYPIDSSQTNCNSLRLQVLDLENQINTIRTEIFGMLSSVNSLKLKKHQKKKDVWDEKKGAQQAQFSSKIQELDAAMQTMTDYSQIIVDYEASN